MQIHHLTYRGGPTRLRRLVTALEAEGLEVEWTPPEDPKERDLSAAREGVATLVVFAVSGPIGAAAVRAGLREFRVRWPDPEVEWREKEAHR